MKKMKLNPAELKVESFGTEKKRSNKGTVAGNNYPTLFMCDETAACTLYFCVPTFAETNCQRTCGYTYCFNETCGDMTQTPQCP
ncbi:MAG: hypothetical protein ACEPO8_08520 [Rhodothermaceae bacterium]